MAGENNFINNLDNFRSCCRKVIALTFAENMTLYENVCAVITKLNEVIDSQNMIIDQVNALTILFQELKEFVLNYFDNLDVQEEINNKLDEMAEDGTLAEIINQNIFNDLNTRLNSEITNRTNGDTALQNQINELVLGSGDSSNEILQAKVNYKGTSFNTLKARIDAAENGSGISFPWRQGVLYAGTVTFTINSDNPSQSVCTVRSGAVFSQDSQYFSASGNKDANLIYNHSRLQILAFDQTERAFKIYDMVSSINNVIRENVILICFSYGYNLYSYVNSPTAKLINNGNEMGKQDQQELKRGTILQTDGDESSQINIDRANGVITWIDGVRVLFNNMTYITNISGGSLPFNSSNLNSPQFFVYNTYTESFEILNWDTRQNIGMGINHVIIFAFFGNEVFFCDTPTYNAVTLNNNFVPLQTKPWNTRKIDLGTWGNNFRVDIDTSNRTISISGVGIGSNNGLISSSSPFSGKTFNYTYPTSGWVHVVVDVYEYEVEFYPHAQASQFAYADNKVIMFTWYNGYLYYCQDHTKLRTYVNTIPYYEYLGITNGSGSKSEVAYPELITTRYIDGVVGRRLNIFFDNLLDQKNFENLVSVSGNTILRGEYGVDYVATNEGNTDANITFTNYNGNIISHQTTFRFVDNNGGDGTDKRIMLLGDSLIDNNYLPSEYFNQLTTDGDYNFIPIGTKANAGILNEGRASWRWQDYLNADEYSNYENPFRKNGVLDFESYLTDNDLTKPDIVYILLGTNDVTQGTSLPTANRISDIIANAKSFLSEMIRTFDTAKIIICLPGIGAPFRNRGSNNMNVFRKAIQTLNSAYVRNFDNGEWNSNVSCINMGSFSYNAESYPYTNTTISDRIASQQMIYTDSIHPTANGYYQWSDSLYFNTRNILSGNFIGD